MTFLRLCLGNRSNLRLKQYLRERSLAAERHRTPVETAVQFHPFAHSSFGDARWQETSAQRIRSIALHAGDRCSLLAGSHMLREANMKYKNYNALPASILRREQLTRVES